MVRKRAVSAQLGSINISELKSDSNMDLGTSIDLYSDLQIDDVVDVKSTQDIQDVNNINQIYYIYFDNNNNKFYLSKSFENEQDLNNNIQFNFELQRKIEMCVNKTYIFIMHHTYKDNTSGSFDTKINDLTERFLIWNIRNYTGPTMNHRLINPVSELGDPSGITYEEPSGFTNYLQGNSNTKLIITPTKHDTLYYFSNKTRSAGSTIYIYPQKFLDGAFITNGGAGISGNLNSDKNLYIKTNFFKIEKDNTASNNNDSFIGVNNNRCKLDLGILKGGIVVPKGNTLTVGYNHIQKYSEIIKSSSNSVHEVILTLNKPEFVNLIIIKKDAFITNNQSDLTLSLYNWDNQSEQDVIFENQSVNFNEEFFSQELSHWNSLAERNYSQIFKKRFVSLKLNKLKLKFNKEPLKATLNDSNPQDPYINISEYCIEIWKLGEKPRQTKSIIRFNIETQGFEGFFAEEPDPIPTALQIKYQNGTNNWPSIGGIKDIDLDTAIDTTTDIIMQTGPGVGSPVGGHDRFFIKEDDPLTKIGINTNTPQSTLDIFGNLNIIPDGNISGVNIGYNTEGYINDYFNIHINNNINNSSIDFSTLGNYNIDLQNNFILDIKDNYIIKSNNLYKTIQNFNLLTVHQDSDTSIGKNNFIKINENFDINTTSNTFQTFDQQNISINKNFTSTLLNDKNIINIDNFNTTIQENLNKNIYGKNSEIYKKNYYINIFNNLNTTISGNLNKTVQDNSIENINKNNSISIHNDITENIKNYTENIFDDYTSNINGISTETYNNQNINTNNNLNTNISGNFDKIIHKDDSKVYNSNFTSIINETNNNINNDMNINIYKNLNYDIYGIKTTYLGAPNFSRNLTVFGNYQTTVKKASSFNFHSDEFININNNLTEDYNQNVLFNINTSNININKNNNISIKNNKIKNIKGTNILNIYDNYNKIINNNKNITIKDNLNETIYNNYTSNISGTNNITIYDDNNTIINKNMFINIKKNENILILKNENITVKDNSNTILNNLTTNTNNIKQTINGSYYKNSNSDSVIYNSNTKYIQSHLSETFKSIYNSTLFNNNKLIVENDSENLYNNNSDIYIYNNDNCEINYNFNQTIHSNFNNYISLNNNTNISSNLNLSIDKNFDVNINNNFNNNIQNNFDVNINSNKNMNINKNIYQNINSDNSINIYSTQNSTINKINTEDFQNVHKYIDGYSNKNIDYNKFLQIQYNDIQIFNKNIFILNKGNKNEIYNNYYNSNVLGNKNLNIHKSNYLIDIKNHNNLSLITNTNGSTILDNDIHNNDLLTTNGGILIKKDTWVGGNFNVNGNINIKDSDLTNLQVTDVLINNPLLLIGQDQTSDNYEMSGILNRYGSSDSYKFTGLVRNNDNTNETNNEYGLVHNILSDSNDNRFVNQTLLKNKIENKNDKDSFGNIIVNKINILNDGTQDDLKTNGSLRVQKNIFIDNQHDGKIIGKNTVIQNTDTDFSIISTKNIKIQTTNNKDINIEGQRDFTKNILGTYNININGNLNETITGTNTKNIINDSNENFNKSSYLNINNSNIIIHKNTNNTIYQNIYTNINGNLSDNITKDKTTFIQSNIQETFKKINTLKITDDFDETIFINKNTNINFNNSVNIYGNVISNINNDYDLTVYGNLDETYKNNKHTIINNNLNLNFHQDYNSNISSVFKINVKQNSNETYNKNFTQHINSLDYNINLNNILDIKKQKLLTIKNNNNQYIDNNDLNILQNSNILINGNNTTNIYDNNTVHIYKNNIIQTNNNVLNNINTNNKINIYADSFENYKSNHFIAISNNNTQTFSKNVHTTIKQNFINNLDTELLLSGEFQFKSSNTSWRNYDIINNVSTFVTQDRYLIAVKYTKSNIIYKSTLLANIDNLDNIKTDLNPDSDTPFEINTKWNTQFNNNKTIIFTKFNDNSTFYLGQYGDSSTMPLFNVDNTNNINLSSGFTTNFTNNTYNFLINDYYLLPLDSYLQNNLDTNNLNIYGNGFNSSNFNIVYFSDLTNPTIAHDKTPNQFTEHISNNNNFSRDNATGTNYNITKFDKNIKSKLEILKDDYINGNSYIFDIDNNKILHGNVNVNTEHTKSGFNNEYYVNSLYTPFDENLLQQNQYNINNWLLPLNSDNNNNEGRLFKDNDYFAFKLDTTILPNGSYSVQNLHNAPKIFDIYGITSQKDFMLYYPTNTGKLLNPSIRSSIINTTPSDLKLTQGITDINKSINNIDITNFYLNTNIYKETLLDLSHTMTNNDVDSDYTHNLLSHFGQNNNPKVVNDPIHFNRIVIEIMGKGLIFDSSKLISDKFTLETYFSIKFNSYTYKHYLYSQSNNTEGFNIYIYNGDIYINKLSTSTLVNYTNFIDSDKIKYNQWYHLALVKNSDIFTIFLNGKKYSNDTLTFSPLELNHTLAIGVSDNTNSSSNLHGYLSDFKIYDDYSLYENDFIPTPSNCLLKLDIHKYYHSIPFYDTYNTLIKFNITNDYIYINGIPNKTIHLIKNIQYIFSDISLNTNTKNFSIVQNLNNYPNNPLFSTDIQNNNRTFTCTFSSTGIYYYYFIDSQDSNNKSLHGIIKVHNSVPILDDIICSSNKNTTIIKENIVVKSDKYKQHQRSLYFENSQTLKSKLSFQITNNSITKKGLNQFINTIQFYVYIINTQTTQILFSQDNDFYLAVKSNGTLELHHAQDLITNIPIEFDKWIHIVYTSYYKIYYLYINGTCYSYINSGNLLSFNNNKYLYFGYGNFNNTDTHFKGYMDNIEVYDNTLLYNDILNIKHSNPNNDGYLSINNKFNNINLYNNKHLLFHFDNTASKSIFDSNKNNIGLTYLDSDETIAYNSPVKNNINPIYYSNNNDGVITNHLNIQTNTSGIYTNNYDMIQNNYNINTLSPIINGFDKHKLNIQLNTNSNPNSTLIVHPNKIIQQSFPTFTSSSYTYNINQSSTEYISKATHSGIIKLINNIKNTTTNDNISIVTYLPKFNTTPIPFYDNNDTIISLGENGLIVHGTGNPITAHQYEVKDSSNQNYVWKNKKILIDLDITMANNTSNEEVFFSLTAGGNPNIAAGTCGAIVIGRAINSSQIYLHFNCISSTTDLVITPNLSLKRKYNIKYTFHVDIHGYVGMLKCYVDNILVNEYNYVLFGPSYSVPIINSSTHDYAPSFASSITPKLRLGDFNDGYYTSPKHLNYGSSVTLKNIGAIELFSGYTQLNTATSDLIAGNSNLLRFPTGPITGNGAALPNELGYFIHIPHTDIDKDYNSTDYNNSGAPTTFSDNEILIDFDIKLDNIAVRECYLFINGHPQTNTVSGGIRIFRQNNSNKINFGIQSNGDQNLIYMVSTYNLTPGVYYNIKFTFNVNGDFNLNNLKCYVNNELVDEFTDNVTNAKYSSTGAIPVFRDLVNAGSGYQKFREVRIGHSGDNDDFLNNGTYIDVHMVGFKKLFKEFDNAFEQEELPSLMNYPVTIIGNDTSSTSGFGYLQNANWKNKKILIDFDVKLISKNNQEAFIYIRGDMSNDIGGGLRIVKFENTQKIALGIQSMYPNSFLTTNDLELDKTYNIKFTFNVNDDGYIGYIKCYQNNQFVSEWNTYLTSYNTTTSVPTFNSTSNIYRLGDAGGTNDHLNMNTVLTVNNITYYDITDATNEYSSKGLQECTPNSNGIITSSGTSGFKLNNTELYLPRYNQVSLIHTDPSTQDAPKFKFFALRFKIPANNPTQMPMNGVDIIHAHSNTEHDIMRFFYEDKYVNDIPYNFNVSVNKNKSVYNSSFYDVNIYEEDGPNGSNLFSSISNTEFFKYKLSNNKTYIINVAITDNSNFSNFKYANFLKIGSKHITDILVYEVLTFSHVPTNNDPNHIRNYLYSVGQGYTNPPTLSNITSTNLVGRYTSVESENTNSFLINYPDNYKLYIDSDDSNKFSFNNNSLVNDDKIIFNSNFNNIIGNQIYYVKKDDNNTDKFKLKDSISSNTNIDTGYIQNNNNQITNIRLTKISNIQELHSIYTLTKHNIIPFKQYKVTEDNYNIFENYNSLSRNIYLLDGVANKFIELYKNDIIKFDLTELTNKNHFKIYEYDNNELKEIQSGMEYLNNNNYCIFNYQNYYNSTNRGQKTFYYVNSSNIDRDDINFSINNIEIIQQNYNYHCFTGYIYNVPNNVTIKHYEEVEEITNNEFVPKLPGKYTIEYNNITANLYVSFGNEIRIKDYKLNVNENDLYTIKNYNNSIQNSLDYDYNMNSKNQKLFGGINLWGERASIDNYTQFSLKTNNTLSNSDYFKSIVAYSNNGNSTTDYITDIEQIKNFFIPNKKGNTLNFQTKFNIIASIGDATNLPYKFNKYMSYNFRAENGNFPKKWIIKGSTDINATNFIELAEHTCVNRVLDSDGFILDGPFYYNKLTELDTSIYWINIEFNELWEGDKFNFSGFYTQVNKNDTSFNGSIKSIFNSSQINVLDMSSDSHFPHTSKIGHKSEVIENENLYNTNYLLSKYNINSNLNSELFYWYYMVIYSHNSIQTDQSYNLGIRFKEFIPKIDTNYFQNIFATKDNIVGPNYKIVSKSSNSNIINILNDDYENGNGFLINYNGAQNNLEGEFHIQNDNLAGKSLGFYNNFIYNHIDFQKTIILEKYNQSPATESNDKIFWIIPLNDAENTKSGRFITDTDKFSFEINTKENAPIRYDIYAITQKNHNLDLSSSNSGRVNLSNSNIIHLHREDDDGTNTQSFNQFDNNHIIKSYNKNWDNTNMYWLVFIFYGINQIDNTNINLSFKEFKTQINTFLPRDFPDNYLLDTQKTNIKQFQALDISSTQFTDNINDNYHTTNHQSFNYNISNNSDFYINHNTTELYYKTLTLNNSSSLNILNHGTYNSVQYNNTQNNYKNKNIKISQDLNTNISANMNTTINNNFNYNINSSKNINIDNNLTQTISGNINNTYYNTLQTQQNSLLYNINKNYNSKIKSDSNILIQNLNNKLITNQVNETYYQDFYSTITKNLTTIGNSNINFNFNSHNNFTIKNNMISNIDNNYTSQINKNKTQTINNKLDIHIIGKSTETFNNNSNIILTGNKNVNININSSLNCIDSIENYNNNFTLNTYKDYNKNIIGNNNTNIHDNSSININGNSRITQTQSIPNLQHILNNDQKHILPDHFNNNIHSIGIQPDIPGTTFGANYYLVNNVYTSNNPPYGADNEVIPFPVSPQNDIVPVYDSINKAMSLNMLGYHMKQPEVSPNNYNNNTKTIFIVFKYLITRPVGKVPVLDLHFNSQVPQGNLDPNSEERVPTHSILISLLPDNTYKTDLLNGHGGEGFYNKDIYINGVTYNGKPNSKNNHTLPQIETNNTKHNTGKIIIGFRCSDINLVDKTFELGEYFNGEDENFKDYTEYRWQNSLNNLDKINILDSDSTGSGAQHTLLYELITYSTRKSDEDMENIMQSLNKKHGAYYTNGTTWNYDSSNNAQVPTPTNTSIDTTDATYRFDAQQISLETFGMVTCKYMNTFNNIYNSELKNTLYNKVNNDSIELYNKKSYITISKDLKETINNKNLTIVYNNTENYNKDFTIAQTGNHIQNIHGTNNIIHSLHSSYNSDGNNSIFISKNLNTTIEQSYNLNVTNNINIKTNGRLNINTDLNRTLDFIGNTGIKYIKSFNPNIITTQNLYDANSITTTGDINAGEYTINPIQTINIISIKDINNISTAHNNLDIFFRLKLLPGKFNGQICKILLHPTFENLFINNNNTTIDQRIENNNIQDVIIRIDSFVDANTNEFVSADIVLNRGGMGLNLIYISTTENSNYLLTNDTKAYSELTNDPNNDSDSNNNVDDRGYWMLMDNNFNTT